MLVGPIDPLFLSTLMIPDNVSAGHDPRRKTARLALIPRVLIVTLTGGTPGSAICFISGKQLLAIGIEQLRYGKGVAVGPKGGLLVRICRKPRDVFDLQLQAFGRWPKEERQKTAKCIHAAAAGQL